MAAHACAGQNPIGCPRRRNIDCDGFLVNAGPGLLYGGVAQIGAENLNRDFGSRVREIFHHGDGVRIGFFAGGATRHPDADRFAAAFLHKFRKDFSAQRLEHGRIAEKRGDVDQEIMKEQIDFIGMLLQIRHVIGELLNFSQDHPSEDSAAESALFIKREIDSA